MNLVFLSCLTNYLVAEKFQVVPVFIIFATMTIDVKITTTKFCIHELLNMLKSSRAFLSAVYFSHSLLITQYTT